MRRHPGLRRRDGGVNVALRPEHLNIISLCTGGAGLDLGVELAIGCARVVCMVEREAFAVTHLVSAMQQGLLAQAPIWSDARTFDGRAWRGAVDGIIGGIPCQPHSLAGKRLGEEDERDLWSDARRIIAQSGAWFVLIENVRGMLSSGGAERVWRDLHRLGFEVEGGLFTASEIGDSQERERFFVLAVADARCTRPQGNQQPGSSAERNGSAPPRPVAELRRARLFPPAPSDLDGWRAVSAGTPHLKPELCRMADGLATRVDRLRMLGNGVVPLQAAYAIRTLATRLAARGSAGAARLVRMMEAAE
ncbi:DNA cytosine methyltransferase [Sinorhizobium meliloti]|nr:DNA cytosine methyltransferase [Sinorhizobium meliloti]